MSQELPEDTETVWVGGNIEMERDAFVEALECIGDFRDAIETIQTELADLNTGLEREDAIRLIYARNHRLTLEQVEATFDAIDDVAAADPYEVGAVLLNRKTNLTMEEVGQVLDDMGTLAEKYAEDA